MCCDEVFIQYHLNSKQGRFIDLNFETLDLHLNKIEISFYVKKKFRYASKEDRDQFLVLKKM